MNMNLTITKLKASEVKHHFPRPEPHTSPHFWEVAEKLLPIYHKPSHLWFTSVLGLLPTQHPLLPCSCTWLCGRLTQ